MHCQSQGHFTLENMRKILILCYFAALLLVLILLDYSEVPNRRADQNKRAGLEESDTLLAYLLSKLINEQGGIFHFTK